MKATIPFEISGSFHVLGFADSGINSGGEKPSDISSRLPGVSGDAGGAVREFQGEGNNLTAAAVEVTPYVAPDLQVAAIAAPERATRGQQFDLVYTVQNFGGDTPALQPSWSDLIYLSRDTFLDLQADRFLASVSHEDGLAAAASYTIASSLTLPSDLATEAYYVFVITDPARYTSTGEVFEGVNERNNDRPSSVPMIVELPPPTDLVVTGVVIPGAARCGSPVHFEWTVTNQSADVTAAGTWTDSLFLSTDATWDIGDRPLGRSSYSGTVSPGGSCTLVLDSLLPPATPGQYRVIVRTDIFDQVYEDVNEANNRTASPQALEVAVDDLQIGVPLLTTLHPAEERLYRIAVPADQTLRITLQAGSDESANEIYVRHGRVPTSSAFDATYSGPLSSDLVAVVPCTEPGDYYLLVRSFSGPMEGTGIVLLAELLPLVITDVYTDAGGDSRTVTTTITGAQFHPDAIVKLVRPGIAEFEPIAWKVVDSSKIIATFDFTGAPHGLYDLEVINPSGDEAVVPYRFLVERAIEADVTIGIGGPRVILAGDQATYSVALQNTSNLDALYTYFQVGVPQLNINQYVFALPYLEFTTNVRGTPEGAEGGANESVPWAQLESITNTNGQLIASGYLYDAPADGFAGFSFVVITYPGLEALHDRAFEQFRNEMAGAFPELDSLLEEGAGGLDAWWQAVKDQAEEVNPEYLAILDRIDFVGLYNENRAVPRECEIPFIPYRFHVFVTATTMTRAEYVARQSQQARDLRQAILGSDFAPGALLALAADEEAWVELYLAALEDAGLLRPDGVTPPVREQQHIVSLMATIASGILFGPSGTSVRSDADLLGFFEDLRELYGHKQDLMAEIEKWDPRQSRCYSGEVPIPALPSYSDYDLGLSQQTHFEAFRIYVPWIPFEERGAGLPEDFQINGPTPVDTEDFAALDFGGLYEQQGVSGRLASLTGPQTYDSDGWLPAGQALPYTIGFQSAESAASTINEIRIVSPLDENLDAHTFTLGDITIGDITVDVPAGRSLFQAEYDFAATRGFILRVSAGVDLYQEPAQATWLIQAIDPLTGEVLRSSSRGLLPPNNAEGAGAGFVSYTVEALADTPSGDEITASARILFDTQAPEDTIVLSQPVDARSPVSSITVSRIGSTDSFEVSWEVSDELGGSGFGHVTLYVATDGGDFKIWRRQLTTASGSLVFDGEAGHSYEFLALATDTAGNREAPSPGVNAAPDDSGTNLGALPAVPGTTLADFGVAPEPAQTPATNPLFTAAEEEVPAAEPLTRPSEFDEVLSPFLAQAFATGIGQSHAGIGPMAIVEAPDGSILVSGGPNRGQVFRFDPEGGEAGIPWASLDEPVFNLAFDSQGRLWATTGGGALLQLDPQTGAVANRFGDGITIALAVEPGTDRLLVSSNSGVLIFDPATGAFSQYNRDLDLRVGSLAFAPDGSLWAVTWPDRRQVVRFTDRARVEVMLEFDSDIDSLAFGRSGTELAGLLFVSGNSGQLAVVDVATLRRVVLCSGGTRGDVVITTSRGQALVSQSGQVDVISPVYAPSVTATNPPDESVVPLPLPFVSVSFDQDMYTGDGDAATSVLNPSNYILAGAVTGPWTVQSVTYDAEYRTVLLTFDRLLADAYTLTVTESVSSVFGLHLAEDYTAAFDAADDLSAYVDFDFGLTRYHRVLETVSYDVTVTNIGDTAIVLPVLLTLDPAHGYPGVPVDAIGQTDDGRWLIDLSAVLPPDGRLEPGESTTGQTISVATPDRRRVDFAVGITAGAEPNRAPAFASAPPAAATVGLLFEYDAEAVDPEGQPVIYHLLSGPEGMSVDPQSGMVSWPVSSGALARTAVVLQAFDSRGAVALQRFVLEVAGGNRAPLFFGLPEQVEGVEGELIELTVAATDPDLDSLTFWADNLPAGASFDHQTRTFSWLPGYEAAGTYPDVRFLVTDGISQASISVTLVVAEGRQAPVLIKPADRTLREGDRIRFYLQAEGDAEADLTFSCEIPPYGATLHPETGLFEWTPGYTQAGVYDVAFAVSDGSDTSTATVRLTVTNANGAPEFEQQEGWQVFEGQPLILKPIAHDPDNPYYYPPSRDADGNLVTLTDNGPTVAVTAGALPAGASFDPETWELSWTPTHLQAGVYAVTFTATDDGDGTGSPLTDRVTVSIEVLNLNRRPVIEPVANVTLQRDGSVEVTVRAGDPEGNRIALTAASEQPGFPLPAFMTFVDNGDGTGLLRIEPSAGDRGDHAVKIVARDDGDGGTGPVLSASYVFVVSVESKNEPPVLAYLGDVVVVVGQLTTVPIRVSDMDQDPLGYAMSGLPAGAAISATAVYGQGMIQWTPTTADLGTYSVTVTVTDSGSGDAAAAEWDTATFVVTVRSSNRAPVLLPVGDRLAAEAQPLVIALQAFDHDDDVLTYRVEGLPNGAILDPSTGAFTWTPALNQAGTWGIIFAVSDGSASSSESITISVANSNQLPSFVPMTAQLGRENAEIRFNVVAADPDADPVTLSVVQGLPAGALFVPTRGELVWTPGYDQAGDHTVRFAAQDPSGTPVTMDVVIRVADANRQPVLSESDHAFVIGQTRSFVIAAEDPDAGAQLTFSAVDLPEGATLETDTGLLSWTPGPGQAGEYVVTFEVSDGQATDSQTVLLRASLEPVPPVARIELTPSFAVLTGQTVLVHAVADSLAEIASLRLFVDGTEIALDAQGRVTLTAASPGRMNLVAVARDADGIEGRAQAELRVRDGEDKAAPAVAFATTVPGAVLRDVTEIRGSVQDSNLDFWRLEMAPGFSEEFAALAQGQAPADGVLASLDPRRIADGFYTLRLTARDIAGREASAEALVEVSTAVKMGQYQRVETDLSVVLGGVTFNLTRQYDSLEQALGEAGSFGPGWSLLGRDVRLETNVRLTGREHLGVFSAFADGTRLYLTLPTGERVGFSFDPVPEPIGDLLFYRPAWTAEGDHGWSLSSADAQLLKAGADYYESATGQAYNPASSLLAGADYTLTAPDGTVYFIDAACGVTEIGLPSGSRLYLGDSGIVSASGEALQFVRDEGGRISRVVAPDGTTLVYTYDNEGLLVAVRNLAGGSGSRYGYDQDRLAVAVQIGGQGQSIRYHTDGSVSVEDLAADLGGAAEFTGRTVSGALSAGETASYTFTLRTGEIESTASGRLILRVALGVEPALLLADPVVSGVGALSVQRTAGSVVALFAVEREGLYELRVSADERKRRLPACALSGRGRECRRQGRRR